MASACSGAWCSPPVNSGVARNAGISAAIWLFAITAACVALREVSVASLLALLEDLWILQAVLVTAVVSLIYRLQSDLASVAGLKAGQRARLDSMVKRKSRRLWLLFLLIAVSALLPRSASVLVEEGQIFVAFAGLALMVATAAYCFYLPAMWNELRQFLTSMVAERERKERRLKELERLGSDSSGD